MSGSPNKGGGATHQSQVLTLEIQSVPFVRGISARAFEQRLACRIVDVRLLPAGVHMLVEIATKPHCRGALQKNLD